MSFFSTILGTINNSVISNALNRQRRTPTQKKKKILFYAYYSSDEESVQKKTEDHDRQSGHTTNRCISRHTTHAYYNIIQIPKKSKKVAASLKCMLHSNALGEPTQYTQAYFLKLQSHRNLFLTALFTFCNLF